MTKKMQNIGGAAVMLLGKKDNLLQNEQGISTHLPYASLEKDDILITANEDRIRMWSMNGLPVDTADNQRLNDALVQRTKLFAHVPHAENFRFYHTLLRTKQSSIKPAQAKIPFAQSFYDDYYQGFTSRPLYSNQHYLSLVHHLPTDPQRMFRLRHRENKSNFVARTQKAHQQLDDASRLIEEQLGLYGIERLHTLPDGSNGVLRFLSKLINWQDQPLRTQPMGLNVYLPKVRLFFGERAIEIRDNTTGQSWYAALIAIKGFGTTETWPGLLDGLLTLPMELCLTQSYFLTPTQKARDEINLQKRRLASAKDPDHRGYMQLEGAEGEITAGHYALGTHQLSVMVITEGTGSPENDLALLEEKAATVHNELLQSGLIPVREKSLSELVYWSQFPGNHRYLSRPMSITTENMACMASFHSKTTGNTTSHWGDPLLLLRTPQNSSYWFNFHVRGRDVGDTLILGEKGSGKTLLLTTLATAALQYQPRIFYFDKDFGAENWFHAVRANHSILGTGQSTGLNPLQLPDTKANRAFLQEWLRSLLEGFGEPLTEEEITKVHQAIKQNYEELKPEQRRLSNLQSALGTAGPGSLRNRLRHWHSDGEFAFYFDNPTDDLKFDNLVTGFEMHYLLQDGQKTACLPVLLYLFHRIQLALEAGDRRPTLLILDEVWAILANLYFSKMIKNWLLTLRKLNAITIFATQNPSDILTHPIAPILVAETVTKIIFRPNTPTQAIYQDALHLTPGEYQALCAISPGSRSFLVKQTDHSIVVNLDLAEQSNYIPIFSSRPREREDVLREVKLDPERWWEKRIGVRTV